MPQKKTATRKTTHARHHDGTSRVATATFPSLLHIHNTSHKRPLSLLSLHVAHSTVSYLDIASASHLSECLEAAYFTTTYCLEYKRLAPAALPMFPMPLIMLAVVFVSRGGGWLWWIWPTIIESIRFVSSPTPPFPLHICIGFHQGHFSAISTISNFMPSTHEPMAIGVRVKRVGAS